MHNIVSVLQHRSQKNGHREAILFLQDGEHETARISYQELDQRAKALAAELQAQHMVGQRALLIYPTGVEFVISLIGCWYAGVIAVPVSCPKEGEFAKQQALINAIVDDADSALVLTLDTLRAPLKKILAKKVKVVATNTIKQSLAKTFQPSTISDDTIAYLQYTSGSTSTPKAAVVTHENLNHSLQETVTILHYNKNSITLTWAPHTHVYGLVCGILVPLYHGTPAIIIPPAAFVSKPLVWLSAMSKYKVTHSGCPNFGYDVCVRSIKEAELADLDLHHWKVAINGGDIVQQQTLEAFVNKFHACGFKLKHFCSAYGMSELAGAIAATPYNTEPQYVTLDTNKQLVSSGKFIDGIEGIAVDPATGQPVAAGEIGEIWLAGKSVVSGYWRRPDETKALFNAKVAGSAANYFKTGDLGFIQNNELFLTGRLKEVIVVYGKKYYPLDFEVTVAQVLKPFEINLPQAAFSTQIAGKEEIIIVQELPETWETLNLTELTDTVRHAFTKQHGVDIYELVFTSQGVIPKTASGKLQRKKCQQVFVEQTLPRLNQAVSTAQPKTNQIQDVFVQIVANVLNLQTGKVDLDAPLSRYSFDSINIIHLTTALNERYQLDLSPAVLYEYATLAEFYTDLLDKKAVDATHVTEHHQQDTSSDIAIIGMSGVFPKAADVDAFWDNLIQGNDCISEVPLSRWDWRNLTLQWGGFLDHVDHFDASFFSISPREAEIIDPQQRMFLQTVWKTIEDAGYTSSAISALKTGLFVGVFNNDYAELLQQNEVTDAYLTTGIVHSMIANRISYVLNLRGPSEAIDTACSSSLVAIHQAVSAILHGDCDIAIAGGVNALITPTSYIAANKAGMLCEDGRCKTFDKNANGYVRGEGVGAILLKKLTRALEDGDHIYGVIKGSATNHGGHVNTLTAPNPNAQAEVIVAACQRANIPVNSLQYIETHGTGTPLGDPIEINGLKKAFQQLAGDHDLPHHFCGLGSVKTHIGHLESAAGIAGVIKILLAMQHETLPANLHLNELNPYIDIKNSPFYIIDKATPWPRGAQARRAGLSSFGFGGTNAHLIIEEGPKPRGIRTANEQAFYPISLSATTETALQQRKVDLLAWLNKQESTPSLASISYTLNLGREHFAQRFCVLVETVEQLKAVLAGKEDAGHPLQAEVNLHLLCDSYLEGETVDWAPVYGDFKEKISLPTYPFALESHWIAVNNKRHSKLHPLIDENISSVNALAFSKQFSGSEFYLREHQVNHEPVLPGVLGLEMARVATDFALQNQHVTRLQNITWNKPIKGDDLLHPIHVLLVPDSDSATFVITDEKETTDYVSGEVSYAANPTPKSVNINALKATLHHAQTPDVIYTYFKKAGLAYGTAFQTIKAIHYDDHQLLAELALPSTLSLNPDEFLLHPCLFDGVLQTTQALLKNRDNLYLPFAIRQMDIFATLPTQCYVAARLVSAPDNDQLPEFDIQVTDQEGTVLLSLNGFSLCVIAQNEAHPEPTRQHYQPVWVEQPVADGDISHFGSMLILGSNEPLAQLLDEQFKERATLLEPPQLGAADYILIALEQSKLIDDQLDNTYYLVHKIAADLIRSKPKHPVQIVCVSNDNSTFSRALVGFAKTLTQEQPNITCRLIELHETSVLTKELNQNAIAVRYDTQNTRFIKQYQPLPEATATTPVLKQGGVYLITGGMGGLGAILATYLAEHYQAKLILSGRSKCSAQQMQFMASLEMKGASVVYLQADVAQDDDVQRLIAQIKQNFGALHGVIHAAGVTQDSYILNKTTAEIAAVFAPKIMGATNLHTATRSEALDFFMLYSSVAAVFGNAGQSDYAYANCFLDEFAIDREQQRALGHCSGQSISINWPLWEEGGITIAPEYQSMLKHSLGIVSLTTEQGLMAFTSALQQGSSNCVVLSGDQNKLMAELHSRSQVNQIAIVQSDVANPQLREKTESHLKNLIAATLKCTPASIQSDLAFEHYGIDSLMIIQLNQSLAAEFKSLPKTLFFEYQNVAALTDYFVAHHASTLNQLFPEHGAAKTVQPVAMPAKRVSVTDRLRKTDSKDIAIIGVSGRYPAAENLTEFWHNLQTGKDCISEIPADRWNLADYFDANKDATSKIYSKWGGFLSDVDAFDPLFFNISPREAALMDPQERLFLETAWKTIEDAGYAREQLAGRKVGVYVGVMYGQYQLFGNEEAFAPTNSIFASIANRVSYVFDFHGPSMALDTMCSSSLTAIHLACQSILDGECQLALAGGVNLSLHPNKYLLLSHGKFLATDGHCRSFGEGGDGYVPGEAVGAVLLKPLNQALADGDMVYAVIKGSQLNHGGKTNGYTVPNPVAQAALIAETYERAHIDPAQVSYIEAHGTGTSLGDPIEIAGLNKVFNQSCAIGSVKSNIGHCESAAGIAAVTKVLLQLKHRTLVPSILADTLNTNIDWSTTGFKVQQQCEEWQGNKIAGISSFGAGGSNAHLILTQAPERVAQPSIPKSHYLIALSAKTEEALQKRVYDLAQWLETNQTASLEQISYTLNAGRSHFECRYALVVSSVAELQQLLQARAFIQLQGKPEQAPARVSELLEQLTQLPRYQETLLALAQCYVNGNAIDWQRLHAGESREKIALPTYPFAKERYWYAKADAIEPVTTVKQGAIVDQVRSFLQQQVVAILKMNQHKLDVEKSLGDYGMDSVHFVELANKIAAFYQVEFTPAVFYTQSTVATIAQYLIEQFPAATAKAHQQVVVAALKQTSAPVPRKHIALDQSDAIAIIGMHGVLPQSADLAAFWQHLIAGDDLVTEVPATRWDWRDYYGDVKTQADKSNSKWGGFIADVDHFDAGFFNISTREANLMDPQQRLFLETVWKTIEDAGYNPLELASQNVGVFAGVEFSEYQTLIANQHSDFHGSIATGNSHSMLANRVSYFFNFQGPSEAIDTACSSSLVAIHHAVQSIRSGECELAIAGGVSLMLNPETFVVTSQLGALSADGRCKTFDQSANGYVKGEGVAALLLKPLHLAQRDGDPIHAVIKASAMNHGGKAQSLTAPNATAQSDLLIHAYSQVDFSPATVSYIEAHGTGTALGDPVEVEGLKLAFNTLLGDEANNTRIALGSVKTNIGHLEPASGIAGLLKIVLAMKHEQLPGILHLNELNSYINLADTPFYIVKETQTWERHKNEAGDDIPLRAGVSSFGFGGANAHVVLEEGRPYQQTAAQHNKPYYLITLSAKQQDSLQQKILDLHHWLTAHQGACSLASLSYTLNRGRAHFNHRCALVVSSVSELLNALQALINNETPEFCMLNNGQVFAMQGPVFDEVYVAAMNAIQQPENSAAYQQKLFILADLYSKHYAIDWEQMYAGEVIPRIGSLPSYPFIKQRYWYDLELNNPAPQAIKTTSTDYTGQVIAYLQNIFAEKLHISPERIQMDETYEVYGVDSVLGLEITNRLDQDFPGIPKTILYERNCLKDLAAYCIKNYKAQLASLVAEVAVTAQTITIVEQAPVVRQSLVSESSRDIAIIGLSGTFPMANTMDEFWQNLATGRDCVGEVPADRWDYKAYPVMVGAEEKVFPHGGFIPDVDKFDPLFFNISPRDAGLMDPQERLFMQSVWSTLEDAGYTRDKLKRQVQNSVGVFAGVTYNFYPMFSAEEWQKDNRVPLDIQSFSVANRISYFLNINGPSFVVDTACSSSLAAIHLACDSILRGDCAMAIAGGVNLSLHPSKYHFLGSFSFMSDKGRCASFAEGGTGYVPSEGVGSVLLKPLAEAIRDNDRIYGVIKGSGMNHGGKTSGYTVPNPNAQAAVILKALNSANIDPRTVSYIEAHGTGTALGDPIEVRGLQDAFETFSDDKQYCAIGSVKSNIGHLESAAGISQLAKVLLQMQHKQLVPSLHAEQLNPFIDFNNSPFYVQRELKDWQPANNMPRRAGVSSFGAGGANVHMIVEEYQSPKKQQDQVKGPYIFVLSALNEERLLAQVQQMQGYLPAQSDDKVWLRDACYTLQLGREEMVARLAIVVDSKEELIAALAHYPDTTGHRMWINHQSQNNVPAVEHLELDALAQQWVSGAKVDWAQLYVQQHPGIVSLPTYAFSKRRCWIPTKDTVAVPKVIEQVPVVAAELPKAEDWLYAMNWEKNPCEQAAVQKADAGTWLVFSDKELGLVLQQNLNAVYCFTGPAFEQLNDKVYYINPAQAADYEQFFQKVHADHGNELRGVVYLCSSIDAAQNDPSQALLHAFQAMLKQSWPQQLTFGLISEGAQQVVPQESINIWQHHLWSMTRIFAAEQPNYRVVLLDLDANESLGQNATIIVNELTHLDANQNHNAYRANERYSIRFAPQQALSAHPWTAPVAALVTGGLGALGYEVADYLATQGTCFLLLTGTSTLSDQTTEKNTWLQQLQSKGVQVNYVAVDVADKEAMQQVIQDTEKAWQHPINGVFHLAGVTTDNVPIADMDDTLWTNVLNVKIKGAMVLHELFLQAPLTDFVLFSSIAAVPYFGMAGLSAYAVANEFMSGLALYRRSLQMPALSMNWVAWSEKGMSHRHNHDVFLDAVGMASLTIKEGIALFDTILRQNPAEVTVCKIHWKKFLQVNATAKQADFFSHFVAEHSSGVQTAVSTLSDDEIHILVLTLFAKVLELDIGEVDSNTPFQQYGMDSIIGINFTASLGEHFPDVVSPMDLYSYPSIKQLAQFISQRVQRVSEPVVAPKEVDIDQLDYEQLNKLIELELESIDLS